MISTTSAEDAISGERAAIASMSKLNAMHWLAVGLSLLLTTGAWYLTSLQAAQQAENRFQRYSDQVIELVQERMRKYEDTLAAAVALVHLQNGEVTYEQWMNFARELEIETKYPGINGIGLIRRVERAELDAFLREERAIRPDFRIHPTHDQDTLYPIVYIEPSDMNAAAVGLDMAHETNRLTATLRARDTGEPQITGPIILVQDAMKTPGFLFHLPVFRQNRGATPEERQENFVGTVYAPFVFRKLIEGVLGKDNRLVHFSVRDQDAVLYDETDQEDRAQKSDYRRQQEVTVYGRTWTFEIWETPEFRAASHSNEPILILVGGLIIDTLLFSLFVLLTRSNHRALVFADRMSGEARQRAALLQRSNEDLERFAYVASHDLKTPLRGIAFLAQCIREDLDRLEASPDNAELQDNLSMLEDQVKRMDNLIKGILTYSSIRSEDTAPEKIETTEFLNGICASVGLRDDQVTLTGDQAEFTTDAIRLEQVLQNLIGNARKYHDDVESLHVKIDVALEGDWLTFTVSDNGPGIEPRYHKKIFEMFQTLHPGKIADSTGIGLAIVQKIVKLYGGQIRLHSRPGEGSSFAFDWPLQIGGHDITEAAA